MKDRNDAGEYGLDLYPNAMRDVLKERKAMYTQGPRAKAGWIANAKRLMEDADVVTLGMPAVYEMSYFVLSASSDVENTRTSRSSVHNSLSREMFMGGSASADLSMVDLSVIHEIFNECASKLGIYYLTKQIRKITAMLHAAEFCGANMDDVDAADFTEKEDSFDSEEWDWAYEGKATISDINVTIRPRCVVWNSMFTAFCLGVSDIRKVIQLVTGVRNYLVGLASDGATGASTNGEVLLRSAGLVRKHIILLAQIGSNLDVGEHLDLCKAYKTCLSIVKCQIAGQMSSRYAPGLIAEITEMDIYPRIGSAINQYISDCKSIPPSGSLPLAKIFRLLPPPDVWIVDALRERWEEASIIKNIGPAKCAEFKTALKEVVMTSLIRDKATKLELRDTNTRPAWWASYLDGDYENVPTAELYGTFVTKGVILMQDRSRYDPTVWKDSGCGADTMEEAMDDQRPRMKKNFLMRMILDSSCPMPEDPWSDENAISEAGLKGESHKKRIFYSNRVKSRMHQSTCDATVGRAMSSHPSFAIQKTGVERDDAFDALSSPPSSEEYARATTLVVALVVLYYSFDIKGWSSRMASDIQMASHEVWDEFTDTTNFTKTAKNREKATVYVNQDGVKAWYTNGSANFEGYNGKEMTALHIAIMTIAVKRLRAALPNVDQNLLTITLQAYIDDGMAKMVLPSDIALAIFDTWCDVVVNTWAEFGFIIERKKSFPSPAYFEFLGEEYYAGTHLATGSKAAMRITADPFERYESLADRVTKLATACRGAAVAGLRAPSAYLLQCYMVADEVAKWVPIYNPTAVSCWLLAPFGMGGVGMPGLYQQGANASGATLEECANNLWSWHPHNPAVAEAYVAVIRRGFLPRTAAEVLSVPLGGKVSKSGLRKNPVGKKVSERLDGLKSDGKITDLGKFMMELDNYVSYKNFAEDTLNLEAGEVYQEALLNDVEDPLPQTINRAFMSRFESARTISYFVRTAQMRRVTRKNSSDAKMSYTSFQNLVCRHVSEQDVTRVGTVIRRPVNTSVIDR
jgi:hypothetical protein